MDYISTEEEDYDSDYTFETITEDGSLDLSDDEYNDREDLSKGDYEYEKHKHELSDFIEDDLIEDNLTKDLIQDIVKELSKGKLCNKRSPIECIEELIIKRLKE
jgi:signal recognition particle GTPase